MATATPLVQPASPLRKYSFSDGVEFEAGPCALADFPPEAQGRVLEYEEDVRAGRFKGIPHEVVRARLDAQIARAEEIGQRLRARGFDAEILMEGTPDEAQAFCDEVFGTGEERVIILGSSVDPTAADYLGPYKSA